MYTIFVNNKPIVLSKQPESCLDLEVYKYNEIPIEEVIHKLRFSSIKGICMYHQDTTFLFETFKKYFTVVYAAGGLVLRNRREILCIFRNKHWDLPKGKMEPGESTEVTALREVQEECGIGKLSIVKPLQITYHIFYEDHKNKLKITHWFLMHTEDYGIPKPQKEEGITLAQYIPITGIEHLYPNMYANISILIKKFLN